MRRRLSPLIPLIALLAAACIHLAQPPQWVGRDGVEVARLVPAAVGLGGIAFSPATDRRDAILDREGL